ELPQRLVVRLEDLGDPLLPEAQALRRVLDHRALVEERLEGAERAFVLWHLLNDLPVGVDRAVDVAQAMVLHLRQAEAEVGDLVAGARDLRLLGQDPRELLPALGVLVEAVERADGALVLRIELEHETVACDRLVEVLELILVDAREAEADLAEAEGIT